MRFFKRIRLVIRPEAFRVKLHIADMLRGQAKEHISFHTPGHKRTGGDITELSYSDNLYNPRGAIAEAERDISRILGAERSFLLTDGSTAGVFSMIYALRLSGRRSVAANAYSHPSVFHACKALGMDFVPAEQEVAYGIPRQPSAEALSRALERADALLLTSPDYYGFFASLKEARSLCLAAKKPLLIDGAHGAHLHGCPMYAGNFADLWVDGVHKSLPAFTQGAAVSARSGWSESLAEAVHTFRTTSPSYPIMASVEYGLKYPRNEAIEQASEALKRRHGCLKNDDWTKIVVPFGDRCGAAQAFLESHGVYPEFNDGNYLMFYLSPCTKPEELERLSALLAELPRGEVSLDAPAGGIPIYSEAP